MKSSRISIRGIRELDFAGEDSVQHEKAEMKRVALALERILPVAFGKSPVVDLSRL